jgi:hypothetical protein
MKFGEDNLNTRKSSFGLDVHRDSSAVIFDGYAAVFLQLNEDFFTVPSQSLIDAVVDDLPKAMH